MTVEVSNPFSESTRSAADSHFTVRLNQEMVSEHPAVAGLRMVATGAGAPGRRVSGVSGPRRRESSMVVPSTSVRATQSSVASSAGGNDASVGNRLTEARGRKKAQGGGTSGSTTGGGSDEMKVSFKKKKKVVQLAEIVFICGGDPKVYRGAW